MLQLLKLVTHKKGDKEYRSVLSKSLNKYIYGTRTGSFVLAKRQNKQNFGLIRTIE